MTYFSNRWNYLNTRRLPDWLPRSGLIFYDSLEDYRSCSYMGHHYTEMTTTDPSNPVADIYCGKVLGERSLLKSGKRNQLTFTLPAADTGSDVSFGCWVCDYGQTGDNIQIFNLVSGDKTLILCLKDSSNRTKVQLWDTAQNKSLGTAYGNTIDTGVGWHFLYAWVGSGYFGVRADGRNNGGNLYTGNHYERAKHLVIESGRLNASLAEGAAMKHVFIYNKVLTAAEGGRIMQGSMLTSGRPSWASSSGSSGSSSSGSGDSGSDDWNENIYSGVYDNIYGNAE